MSIVLGQLYLIKWCQNDGLQKKLKKARNFLWDFCSAWFLRGPRDQNGTFWAIIICPIADFSFFDNFEQDFGFWSLGPARNSICPIADFPPRRVLLSLSSLGTITFQLLLSCVGTNCQSPKVPHFVSVNVITAALRFADEAPSVCCRGLSSFEDGQHSVHLRLREQERGAILGLQYCLLRGLGNQFGLPNHLIPVSWGGWGCRRKLTRVCVCDTG